MIQKTLSVLGNLSVSIRRRGLRSNILEKDVSLRVLGRRRDFPLILLANELGIQASALSSSNNVVRQEDKKDLMAMKEILAQRRWNRPKKEEIPLMELLIKAGIDPEKITDKARAAAAQMAFSLAGMMMDVHAERFMRLAQHPSTADELTAFFRRTKDAGRLDRLKQAIDLDSRLALKLAILIKEDVPAIAAKIIVESTRSELQKELEKIRWAELGEASDRTAIMADEGITIRLFKLVWPEYSSPDPRQNRFCEEACVLGYDGNIPMYDITLEELRKFVEFLNSLTGIGYRFRIPTEDEAKAAQSQGILKDDLAFWIDTSAEDPRKQDFFDTRDGTINSRSPDFRGTVHLLLIRKRIAHSAAAAACPPKSARGGRRREKRPF